MDTNELEQALAKLPPDELRPILSRLASVTPEVVYYAKDFGQVMMADLPDTVGRDYTSVSEDGVETSNPRMSRIGQGMLLIAIACAEAQNLEPGDTVTGTFGAAVHGGKEMGDFVVTVRKI